MLPLAPLCVSAVTLAEAVGGAGLCCCWAATYGPAQCRQTRPSSNGCGRSPGPSAAGPSPPSSSSHEPACQTSAVRNLWCFRTTGSGFAAAWRVKCERTWQLFQSNNYHFKKKMKSRAILISKMKVIDHSKNILCSYGSTEQLKMQTSSIETL